MLLNNAEKQNTVDVDAKKVAKREAFERFRQRRAEQKVQNTKNAQLLKDKLSDMGVFVQLPADLQSFLSSLSSTEVKSGNSITGVASVFAQIFGTNPQIGDSRTLGEVFEATAKGKATMSVWLKRWAEKGVVVEFALNKEKVAQSTYTIMSMVG